MFGSLQISRGCPFTCEFCDIIRHFRRRPRLKTSAQVFGELEAFLRAGLTISFVVDDILIGNKKAIKPILRDIVIGQGERGYPLVFVTEASLDLAEDHELMELLGLANFGTGFSASRRRTRFPRETKKLQNLRPNAGTLLERVHRVQTQGIDVWCGMIVGFDHDDPTIFDVVPKFLAEARIATALIGMLHAIPTTPLYKRLKEEGRLSDDEGVDSIGTNVIPLGMSREELRDGFVRVMQESYKPEAYFGRVNSQFIDQNFKFTLHQLPYWKSHRLNWMRRCLVNYIKFTVISSRLMRLVPDEGLRTRYRRQLWRVLRARWREPHILFVYSLKVAFHYHYTAITQTLSHVGGGAVQCRMQSGRSRGQSGASLPKPLPRLVDAGPKQFVNVDDADRPAVLDHKSPLL